MVIAPVVPTTVNEMTAISESHGRAGDEESAREGARGFAGGFELAGIGPYHRAARGKEAEGVVRGRSLEPAGEEMRQNQGRRSADAGHAGHEHRHLEKLALAQEGDAEMQMALAGSVVIGGGQPQEGFEGPGVGAFFLHVDGGPHTLGAEAMKVLQGRHPRTQPDRFRDAVEARPVR